MPKPRILIYMHYLELGGAETALIGMLNALDPERVDIDLFLGDIRGPLVNQVPAYVNILPPLIDHSMVEKPIRSVVRHGMWGLAVRRLWAKREYAKYVKRTHPRDCSAIFGYVGHYVTPSLASLRRFGEYDLAISYMTPHNLVLQKVSARRKACWVHTDYSKVDVNVDLEHGVWESYDYVVGVSEDVTAQFVKKFPTTAHKAITVENMLPVNMIRQRAQDVVTDMPRVGDGVNLLTIGRYCEAKRLDAIPAIARRLINRGLPLSWSIIGYGGSDEYIRHAIDEAGVADHVHLLGKRENPYPYIAACDWYVQPSLYEGKSIVVREAQILCRPVIITDYATARSQVNDGTDGVIVPMDIDACADAMYAALTDSALHGRITGYLSTHDMGNTCEAEKIYNMTPGATLQCRQESPGATYR